MVLTGTMRRYTEMASVLTGDYSSESPVADRAPTSQGGSGASSPKEDIALKFGNPGPPSPSESYHVPPGGSSPAQGRHAKRITLQLHRLNELCAGKLDSLLYNEMREQYPREYEARANDKLYYRYPGVGGESYMDLILRLDSVILQLEQTRGNAIVVCDRAVCRVLVAYFERFGKDGADINELPHMDVQGGVIELRRSHSGFSATKTPINVGAATSVAGPGTDSLAGQLANRLTMTGLTPRRST